MKIMNKVFLYLATVALMAAAVPVSAKAATPITGENSYTIFFVIGAVLMLSGLIFLKRKSSKIK